MKTALPLVTLAFALTLAARPGPAEAAETVSVPGFRSVQLRGGGTVSVRPGPRQRVTLVSGSTAFTTVRVRRDGQLEIDACNARCPQRYELEIVIESPAMPDAAVSGGGRIVAASGFAPQRTVSAAVRGGGQVDLRAVDARDANAAVHGGGAVLVRAAARLNAAVMGGGNVRYWGNPQVNRAVSGGGSVRRGVEDR